MTGRRRSSGKEDAGASVLAAFVTLAHLFIGGDAAQPPTYVAIADHQQLGLLVIEMLHTVVDLGMVNTK